MYRLSNQICAYIVNTRPLLLMLISPSILVFVYVQLLMVLRMVYLVHSNWYHASKVHLLYLSIIWQTLPSKFQIYAYVQAFNPNSQHICRGANATNLGFIKLVQTLLHMVNMLGQATWIQLNLFHIFVEVVKKGEIESPSLVLTN